MVFNWGVHLLKTVENAKFEPAWTKGCSILLLLPMPPFRLQYASNLFVDLHKLKYDSLVRPVSSSLALLGNIGVPDHPKTYHFLNYCSSNWDSVFWIRGSHEVTLHAVQLLSKQFPNVRCLTAEEEVLPFDNTVLLRMPSVSSSSLEKASLTHTLLRTVFWSVTNPMTNIVFLTTTPSQKNLIPLQGSQLETPSFLWLVGDGPKNGLAMDAKGKQFFATNKCFSDKRLQKLSSYSPIAYVEFADPSPPMSLRVQKQSLQLA